MIRPSNLAVLGLFARTAMVRCLNRTAQFKSIWKKASDPQKPRLATAHRAERRSWFSRLAEHWLPLTAFLGMLLLSIGGLISIFEVFRLQDMQTSAAIALDPDEYRALELAAGTADPALRDEAVKASLTKVFGEASKLAPQGTKLLSERFQELGLGGFRAQTPSEPWRGVLGLLSPPHRADALRAVGAYLLLLNGAMLCILLGTIKRSLASNNVNLNWLITFPISRRTLFLGKLIEYSLDTPLALLNMIWAAIVLGYVGASFWFGCGLSMLLGIAVAVAIGAIRLIVEIALLRHFGSTMRATLVGLTLALGNAVPLLLIAALNSAWLMEQLVSLAAVVPQSLLAGPLSLGIGTALMVSGQSGLWWLTAVLLSGGLAIGSVFGAARQIKFGIEVDQPAARTVRPKAPRSADSAGWLGGMARKEWLQICRQPEFLAKVVSGPITILSLLYFSLPAGWINPEALGSGALCQGIFAAAVMLVLTAAAESLGSELKSFWLLQCQPQPVAQAIGIKARVWGTVSIALAVPLLVVAIIVRPNDATEILARTPCLLLSIWLMAQIMFDTVALGASINNEQTVRFRRSTSFLPMFLGLTVAVSLSAGDFWSQCNAIVLVTGLHLAVRQRLRAQITWLSEPDLQPPLRFDALHALIVLFSFGLVRDLLKGLIPAAAEVWAFSNTDVIVIAYTTSALAVWIATTLRLGRESRNILPRKQSVGVLRPMLGAAAIVCSTAIGLILLYRGTHTLDPAQTGMVLFGTTTSGLALQSSALLYAGLLVLVAPIFEEWLFRGLLFHSLRGSLGVSASAVLGCLIFTVEHPLVSCGGVLTLAICNQWLVQRTGRLWPAILVHMCYNATVVLMWNIYFAAL